MPSEYTGVYKRSRKTQTRGGIETKKITCPYLERNQSMKITSQKWFKSIDTLTQDHRLHTKEFFNLWNESSSLPNANKFLSFPSKLSKIYIRGPLAKPFYELYPQTILATQKKFPSLNKKESKTPQKGEKKIPKNSSLCTMKKKI